jgi:hypothetical protein
MALGSADARTSAGAVIPAASVTVPLTAINALISAGTTGPCQLTYYTPDGTQATVTVTLYDHGNGGGGGNGKPEGPAGERITGDDFSYGVDEPHLTTLSAMDLADVDARTSAGALIPHSDLTVDATELQDINDAINAGTTGDYPLTFITPDGTEVTVTVTLKDHGNGGAGGNGEPEGPAGERVTGDDFTYGVEQPRITTSQAIGLADVEAYTSAGAAIDPSDLTVDAADLAAINAAIDADTPGSYPLTFYTPDGTQVTVTVTLVMNVPSWTVTFKDWNGTTLRTEIVSNGGIATAPSAPSRTGYTFAGWDRSFSNVTQDITVNAVYTIKLYTVTFVDWDGRLIKTEQVPYGGSATAPAAPTRSGYAFTGWDRTYTNVTGDLTVKAQYQQDVQEAVYTVTFADWDGKVLKKQKVKKGGSATAPAKPSRAGYTFTGWDRKYTNVQGDITVKAQYKAKTYTVTFVDYDGKVLKKQKVKYGADATAPSNPSRSGYTFGGWDRSYRDVKADITVTAKYSRNPAPSTVTRVVTVATEPEPAEPEPEEETAVEPPAEPDEPVVEDIPVEETEPPETVPETQEIDETGIPFGSPTERGAWSLLSLILSLVAVVVVLVTVIGAAMRRRRRDSDADFDWHIEQERKKDRKARPLMIAAVIFGILTPVVWLILDNLLLPVAWVNVWTPFVAALCAVHIVLTCLYRRRRGARHGGDDGAQAYAEE